MGGFKVEGIFMTTQGGDLVTYMNAMHSHAKLANGKPVYDGYLSRNPGNVGRVNQCADRGRTLHGVGQPDVQRELSGLANRTAKNQ